MNITQRADTTNVGQHHHSHAHHTADWLSPILVRRVPGRSVSDTAALQHLDITGNTRALRIRQRRRTRTGIAIGRNDWNAGLASRETARLFPQLRQQNACSCWATDSIANGPRAIPGATLRARNAASIGIVPDPANGSTSGDFMSQPLAANQRGRQRFAQRRLCNCLTPSATMQQRAPELSALIVHWSRSNRTMISCGGIPSRIRFVTSSSAAFNSTRLPAIFASMARPTRSATASE